MTCHCRNLIYCWLLLFLAASQVALADDRRLVLVTAESSAVTSLSQPQLRRLFLGLPVEANGLQLMPLLNRSDPLAYQIFLQKLIYMSARNYERRLLGQVLRFGGSRPVIYTDPEELLQKIQQTSGAVSFIWEDRVRDMSGIQIVGEL